jgi:hypothetical protein
MIKGHKRPNEVNQQIAKSVRPQLPRDGSANGTNTVARGALPPGYMAVWNFGGQTNTKESPTTKPETKHRVYK